MNTSSRSCLNSLTRAFTTGTAAALLLCLPHAQLHAGSENTNVGTGTLQNNTSGSDDTAFGYASLLNNSSASFNTALGSRTLVANTTGAENTAVGYGSLYLNTTGFGNTALGVSSLLYNTTGGRNTATGHSSLQANTTAQDNTALGFEALFANTTGSFNTATGSDSLYSNTTGLQNTAAGKGALFSNTTGSYNTATGYYSLLHSTTGSANTATGWQALANSTTGASNVADGFNVLLYNTTGGDNTAIGIYSLESNTTGNYNTALGASAGIYNTTGSYNIDIANVGAASDSAVIRIGDSSNQTQTLIAGIYGATVSGGAPVYIISNGKLGTLTSSARYKQDIHDMDKASDALYALRPVAFRYKPEYDATGLAQFGLVAEEVEKVAPELVIHEADGQPYSVRYEQVNAMLLNEFLKEHARGQEQAATVKAQQVAIARLETANAEQAKALAQTQQELRAQAALVQKISARIDAGSVAPSLEHSSLD